MSNELNLKQKLLQLKAWMPQIIETVKKDLRNDHLKQDYVFVKKYFGSKNIQKLENAELVEAYLNALDQEEKGEEIAEFIAHRWIFQNSEMYHYYEQELTAINSDFAAIQALTDAQAEKLIEGSTHAFGALRTYIFSLLNAVALSQEQFKSLADKASKAEHKEKQIAQESQERLSLEEAKQAHEREIARLTDKYEKKLLGFQKKYMQDVSALKKQLANLQRKLG